MNSRLGLASAYNRPRNLSPISPTATPSKMSTEGHNSHNRSATVTKLQKEIKHLTKENLSLKSQIVELRDTVKQIFNETRHEKFDERRINVIKFQIIQLERQISILTEALGCRSEVLLEVENTMSMMADRLRSFIAAEVKGKMVPIARSDLMTLVESSESARIKLFKSVEKNTSEELGKDLLYLNPCMNNTRKKEEPVTLLDINLNRLEFINLRYVSQLESKLSLLYKELVRIHNQLETIQGEAGGFRLFGGHSTQSECERLKTSLLKTGTMIKDSADDLLSLSLLCPSAPWPILKRPVVKDIPLERVTNALPPLNQTKEDEVNHVIKACLGTLNYRINSLQNEKAVQQEEIAFHRAVYDTQMEYTNAVFDAVREGCKEFEASARKLLCAPLKSLLDAYRHLETSKSEDALRKILLNLKANESQMTSIVEMFEDPKMESSMNRSETLSSFSTEFMEHVNSLVVSCQKKRDAAVQEKKEVKESLRSSELQLQQCIEELEAKYDKQWIPKKDKIEVTASTHSSEIDDSAQSTARSSSGRKDKLKAMSGGCRNSKEFIHSQLFDDLDNKDSNVDGAYNRIYSNKSESFDNDNTEVLKLRSYLDDNEDSGNGVNCKSKKSFRNTKWVSDFSSPKPETLAERNNADSSLVTTQAKSKKPWKADKEWVDDFSNNSNPSDMFEDLTLDSKESIEMSRDKRASSHNNQKEVETEKHGPAKPHQKRNRRSYEVDLRVARQRLKLKNPGIVPTDLNGGVNKKS